MSLKKNMLLNSVKQMCTVIFPLITFPYISRVLQDEHYGKYSFASSVISYFALFATLGIPNYAVREGSGMRNSPSEIDRFASEVFSINIVSTILAYVLLFITMVSWKNLRGYKELLLILSVGLFFTTLGAEWLFSIYENYVYITLRSIIVQVVALICMFFFVKKSNDYLRYAAITVLASGGANVFNFFYVRKYIHLRWTWDMNLKKHFLPMLILLCNAIMVTIYVNSDITILGILKGDSVVGVYSVAAKIYTIVKNLLNAIIVVSIPRLSLYLKNKDYESYNQIEHRILKCLCIILFPALVGLLMVSKEIVVFISGASFAQAYMPLRILCLALGFSVLASFFTMTILLPHCKEKKILIATVVSSVVNLVLNFLIIPFWGFNGAAATTVIAEGIVMILSLYFSRQYLMEIFCGLRRTVFMVVIECIGIVMICLLVEELIESLFAGLIIKIILSGLFYFFVLIAFKEEEILEYIRKVKMLIYKIR